MDFDAAGSKTPIPSIKRIIQAFLGDRSRNTHEIYEHINSTMRIDTTIVQLLNMLSKDKDIVKVGSIKRSGILSPGDYEIAVWAFRHYITRNIVGWPDGTPIFIDGEGTVFFGDEPMAD